MSLILWIFTVSPDKKYSLRKAWRFLLLTVSDHGVRALWRGNTATMVRIAPYAAIQFTSHEQYKLLLHPSNPRYYLVYQQCPTRFAMYGRYTQYSAEAQLVKYSN